MPFICGARTFDHNLNLSFQEAEYNSTLNILEVEVSIHYEKYPLESLYISYLIFNMASELEITSLTPDSTP